jgi:hypothetical protein
MAPAFVKPYLKPNKNDRNDAEVICEVVQRPSMRFVAAKSPEPFCICTMTDCSNPSWHTIFSGKIKWLQLLL